MEHRWGSRRQVDAPVRLIVSPGAIGAGRLRNLSVTGAYVETNLVLGALALVQVELPGAGGATGRRATACVVRRDSSGVGLEWCELPDRAVDELLRSVTPAPADARSAGLSIDRRKSL